MIRFAFKNKRDQAISFDWVIGQSSTVLYSFTSDDGKMLSPAKQWNIGNPLPEGFTAEVEADGDELAMLIGSFSYLPFRHGAASMRWTGETAIFIAENMSVT